MKKMIVLISYVIVIKISFANDKIFYIYQDADLSNHKESSQAIQRGIELAFHERNNQISGYRFKFKYLDHRGNVVRSKRNYKTFISDSKALVIFSGIHSPPLIKNRTFINEEKALTLVPWAAGGPITRYPSPENWIFRLSLDDTKAASVLIDFAFEKKQCKNPYLLLEKTLWGDSNLNNMLKELKVRGVTHPNISRFAWNISEESAKKYIKNIVSSRSDCIVLVANAIEGAVLIKEIIKEKDKLSLPIISHWGIVGGDFHKKITDVERRNIDLHFIQSCFSFVSSSPTDFSQNVFNRLKQYSKGVVDRPEDIKAMVGFVHAYDITLLLIQAIEQSKLTGDIIKDRNTIRLALENLNQPVQGLIKLYKKPFSIFNVKHNFDAHEALEKKDYCMGKYLENNSIMVLKD